LEAETPERAARLEPHHGGSVHRELPVRGRQQSVVRSQWPSAQRALSGADDL